LIVLLVILSGVEGPAFAFRRFERAWFQPCRKPNPPVFHSARLGPNRCSGDDIPEGKQAVSQEEVDRRDYDTTDSDSQLFAGANL
jgi:hypothetical protein